MARSWLDLGQHISPVEAAYAAPVAEATPPVEWLDAQAAARAIRQLTELPGHRLLPTQAGSPAWISEHGMLLVAGSSDARIGYGIRSAIAPSHGLLAAVAQVNQSDPAGHIWLVDDEDDQAWSLVWGLTLPYSWLSSLDLQRAVFTCLTGHLGYLVGLVSHFAPFGGHPYWPSALEASADIQALGQTLHGHVV